MIEEFKEVFRERYQLGRERKAQGQRIIGWLCTYFPEEVYLAAGMQTFRILGGAEETPKGDAHLYSNLCTFVRNCLEEALRGHYNFLAGLVTCNTCEHIRRLYDVWKRYVQTPYTHIFSLPCKASEPTIAAFREELWDMKENLEAAFKVQITDEALREAISLCNRTRTLLKRLYNLRSRDFPPISGSEIMEVVRAGMVMPKSPYNTLLEGYLEKLELLQSPISDQERKPRLLLMGSELDDPKYLREIEELGGQIVADDLCCGSKYLWDLVDEEGEPWEALARRYLYRSQCPRMHPAQRRIQHLEQMAETFRVQGVIYQTLKFCGPHAGMYPVIKNAFDRMGIPVLRLEREYSFTGGGQLRTRVQAFFESMS